MNGKSNTISPPPEEKYNVPWKREVREWAEKRLKEAEIKRVKAKEEEEGRQAAYFNGQRSAYVRLIQRLPVFDD